MDNTLWNSLHPLNSIDTIVHLGAGKCSWLDTYLKSSAKNIVLVEPEPTAAKYLRTRAKEDARIQVLEKAVALDGERATIIVYNLRQASSLREPSGLKNLYPGIRKINEIDVVVVKLEDVLQDVIDKIWLVVDVPGEELTIVKSLEQQGLLQKCSLLSVSCGEIKLYEDGATLTDITGMLENEGFERLVLDDNEDPDRPFWTGMYNVQAEILKQRDEELINLRNNEKNIAHNFENEKKELFLNVQSLENKNQNLEFELRKVQEKMSIDSTKVKQLESQLSISQAKNDELINQNKIRDSQVLELSEKIEASVKKNEDSRQTIQELTIKLEHQGLENRDLLSQIDKYKKEIHLAENKITELENSISKLDNQRLELEKHVQQLNTDLEKRKVNVTEIDSINTQNIAKIENLQKEKDQFTKQIQDQKNKISNLEQTVSELRTRLSLSSEEMVRAEGQIDLIRDLLLRDGGL